MNSPFRSALTPAQALAAARKLESTGQLDAAQSAYQAILRAKPDHAPATHLLGLLLCRQRHRDDGLRFVRRSIELSTSTADFHNNLGVLLAERAATRVEAIAAFRRALDLRPDHPQAPANLGFALHADGQLFAAREMLGRAATALARGPRGDTEPPPVGAPAGLFAALAHVNQALGDADAAIAAYRAALAITPGDAALHSNLCLTLNYADCSSQEEIFDEHVLWANRHAPASLALAPCAPVPLLFSSRRPRLAYLSPELRDHPGARFLAPVLAGHDRSRVEVFVYADVARPDAVTRQLQPLAEHWVDVSGLSDDQLFDRIRADGIDVLIESTGHMPGNRLKLLARRPAPRQFTWPGYPGTTGLTCFDACLTDEARDPIHESTQRFCTEPLLRLPLTSQAFDPHFGSEPELFSSVAAAVSTRSAPIRFACLGRLAKITATTLRCWAAAMNATPDSTLLLLLPGREIDHPPLRDALRELGVAGDRVHFAPRGSREEFLRLHAEVDVLLDTYPYHGHTTTLDAVALGMPTISLAGSTRAARECQAILCPLGLDDFIVDAPTGFGRVAASLDRERLSHLRTGLRGVYARSCLADGRSLARGIENAVTAP